MSDEIVGNQYCFTDASGKWATARPGDDDAFIVTCVSEQNIKNLGRCATLQRRGEGGGLVATAVLPVDQLGPVVL